MFRIASVLTLLVMTIGCVAKGEVLYIPQEFSAEGSPAALNTSRKAVVVGAFRDLRPDKRHYGVLLDRFLKPAGYMDATNDLSVWMTDALKNNLQQKGYIVVPAENVAMGVPVITGDILKIWLECCPRIVGGLSFDPGYTFRATVKVQVRIEGAGCAPKSVSLSGEAAEQAKSLFVKDMPDQKALSRALYKTLSDTITLLDTFYAEAK